MNDDYKRFLEGKRVSFSAAGFDVDVGDVNPLLFDWQRDIVKWALGKGRAALFEDCGLGKTFQQLEWGRLVSLHCSGPVIIFTPLAVAEQTQREGAKLGIKTTICESQADIQSGINITNYEKLHKFDPSGFAGIVLDESSILKGFDGSTRQALTEFGEHIPYRLCCTATPAPNDLTELTRHAEFLGIMDEKEVKALFFTQDGNTTTKWRLKRHAVNAFWKFMASWSIALRRPSDLGYDDGGFILPSLNMHSHVVDGHTLPGMLFPMEANTMSERREARRESLEDRCQMTADLVNSTTEAFLVWCDLNAESELLTRLIPDAVEVKGSDSADHKRDALLGFSDGKYRVLVTKPTIAGFGMNWQHCNQMAFVGLSDSYEQQYQAIRRCWRFGQARPVHIHVITANTEGAVVRNIERKEQMAADMFENIVKHMSIESELNKKTVRFEMAYEQEHASGNGWDLYLGDSVETIEYLEDESIGLSVFSPPFPGMYVYTNSVRDMGNVKDNDEMIEQFSFLANKILAKTMPGRSCAIHLTQGTAQLGRDGYVGLKDFRGQVIRMMEDCGWIYYGECTIDKNPQVKAIRTKDHGLMFKSLASDSSKMHMALADYLLQFRKPGDNPTLLKAGISERYDNMDGWITSEEWIRWARPVWYASDWVPDKEIVIVQHSADEFSVEYNDGKWDGIQETDVLNVRQARETNDERHLAPLQLGVIERAVKLWSGPGELIYSPFAGIGSEGYVALQLGRRFAGGELKRSYWESAVKNLKEAERLKVQPSLFDIWTQ